MTEYRTDRNNNPTAFTTDIAELAHLRRGVDFENGDAFQAGGKTYYTARLLPPVNPVELTVQVIDEIGFYTDTGALRWAYIGIPFDLWRQFTPAQKLLAVWYMYRREGNGGALNRYFARAGNAIDPPNPAPPAA